MRISDWSSDVCSSDLPDTGLSPRLAPPMLGLGLLEAIHQDDILAHAERDHGDGISGRPNWIKDSRTGERVLGRFNCNRSAVLRVGKDCVRPFSSRLLPFS